jgi:hypothetical protein
VCAPLSYLLLSYGGEISFGDANSNNLITVSETLEDDGEIVYIHKEERVERARDN